MSNKIEEIIALHNDILDARTKETLLLEQRIKSRCRQAAQQPSLLESLNFRFLRLVTAYAFLFFILIFANFFLIQSLKDKGKTTTITGPDVDIFMAAVPGSIASAYSEVSQWAK